MLLQGDHIAFFITMINWFEWKKLLQYLNAHNQLMLASHSFILIIPSFFSPPHHPYICGWASARIPSSASSFFHPSPFYLHPYLTSVTSFPKSPAAAISPHYCIIILFHSIKSPSRSPSNSSTPRAKSSRSSSFPLLHVFGMIKPKVKLLISKFSINR